MVYKIVRKFTLKKLESEKKWLYLTHNLNSMILALDEVGENPSNYYSHHIGAIAVTQKSFGFLFL